VKSRHISMFSVSSFDLLEDHSVDLFCGTLARYQLPNLKTREKTGTLLPVTSHKGLGCAHDVISN